MAVSPYAGTPVTAAMLVDLSLTVPRYTNGRASDLNSLQEIIHVSRLSFFTHSLTRSFFVSSLKERNYTYSMYLSTVKVGVDFVGQSLGEPFERCFLGAVARPAALC